MNTKLLDAICKKAVKAFGKESQEDMVVGEIGELLTMFGRRSQGRDSPEAWIDEIADVTIMMRQMAHIYGIENVDARIDEKLKRLSSKML